MFLGGLWRSTNAGGSWNRLEGYDDNAVVSSVTRLGNGTIYVGSGSSHDGGASGSVTGSGSIGHGLFKSTNDGESFTNVFEPAGNEFTGGTWSVVDEVVASPIDDDVVWVAYNGGLITYNDETSEVIIKVPSSVDDFDISNDGLGVICVRGTNILVSQDGGENFTNVVGNGDGEITGAGGRKVVAISPENKEYMYVTTTASGRLRGVYASMNGGEHFSEIINDCDGNLLDFCPFGSNTQGWYDNCLTVVPNNPGKVILGGIQMYQIVLSPASTETQITAGWDQINNNFGFPSTSYVHSDIHTFEWDSNGIMYTGTDGGIFRSENTAVTSFYNLNFNYVTTQFYGIGFNEFGNIFGGMQDNGTVVIPGAEGGFSSPAAAVEINSGDGFDVEVSNNTLTAFVASQYNQLGVIFYNLNGGGSGGPIGVKPNTSGQGMAPFYSCFKYFEKFNENQAPNSIMYIAPSDIDAGDNISYTSGFIFLSTNNNG